jgi:hypothetical protein
MVNMIERMWNVGDLPKAPPDEPVFIGVSQDDIDYETYNNREELTILGLTDKEDQFLFGCVGTLLVIVFSALIYHSIQPRQPQPCDDSQSFICLDHRVQECVASEKYTQDQCVTIVGGNKP